MATKRPTIPRSVRWRGAVRRWFRATVRDIRELRAEHAEASGKPLKAAELMDKARDTGMRRNPWSRCSSCHRRRAPELFECDEPEHAEVCNDCCGCVSRAGRGGGGAVSCGCSGGCDCSRDDELEDDEDDYGDDEQGPDQGGDTQESEGDNDHHH